MRVEIVLFFVLQLCITAIEDGGYTRLHHKVEDHSKCGAAGKVESTRARRSIPWLRNNESLNVHPDDIAVIKDAIKKLLGRQEISNVLHHGPSIPTRSSVPTSGEFLGNLTETTSTTLASLPGNNDKVETLDQSQTTETDAVQKLDWFEKHAGQEIEYSTSLSSTIMPQPFLAGEVTQKATRTSNAISTEEPAAPFLDEEVTNAEGSLIANTSLGPAPLRAVLRERTRHTRRTTQSTRNTLCTDSDDFCRTMCFDHEKYRVSCPTTAPPPTTPRLDMTKLLNMLSELVADYDTNLTAVMNHTLIEKGYKQCEPTTTTATTTLTTAPPTPPMYDYEPSEKTGSVISKCFVCGMESLGIPSDAECSDPFAKDLLPSHMPDRHAEIKRKSYRKYCKYMDMKPWYINGSGIWGKWTGGCAVRWVDLSGVYTQRTCRIRDRPAIGRHFVSKRLAKLEFALRKVDNGCMLSPMATLVPFSRGVSLYARLHVCVCSANWCNRAGQLASSLWLRPSMGLVIAVLR